MYSLGNKCYLASLNKYPFHGWDGYKRPLLSVKSSFTPKQMYSSNSALPLISKNSLQNETTTVSTQYNNYNNNININNSERKLQPYKIKNGSFNNLSDVGVLVSDSNAPIGVYSDLYSKERKERRQRVQNEIQLMKMQLNESHYKDKTHPNCSFKSMSSKNSFRSKRPKLHINSPHKEEIKESPVKVVNTPQYNDDTITLCTCPRRNNSVMLSEKEEFEHTIPTHLALQLQKENFKTRKALETIFHKYRSLNEDYELKLKKLEMRQKINFQKLRNVIEYSGTNRMKGAVQRYIDGENINLDSLKEETKDYLRDFPFFVDGKIIIHENKRKPMQQIKEDKLIEETEEEQNEQTDLNEEILPENILEPVFNCHDDGLKDNKLKKSVRGVKKMQRASCGSLVIFKNIEEYKNLQKRKTKERIETKNEKVRPETKEAKKSKRKEKEKEDNESNKDYKENNEIETLNDKISEKSKNSKNQSSLNKNKEKKIELKLDNKIEFEDEDDDYIYQTFSNNEEKKLKKKKKKKGLKQIDIEDEKSNNENVNERDIKTKNKQKTLKKNKKSKSSSVL